MIALRAVVRSLTVIVLGCTALLAVSMTADLVGAWVLSRDEAIRFQEQAASNETVSKPRPALDPTQQENAVVAYRQVLAQAAAALSRDDLTVLAREDATPLAVLTQRFGARSADTNPFDHALHCTVCDWRVEFHIGEPIDSSMFAPARFLAYSLVLHAAHAIDAGDWLLARQDYFAALRFGGDRRQTNMVGARTGIAVARLAIDGLAAQVPRLRSADSKMVPLLRHDLAALSPYVLGVGEAPRVERLETYNFVLAEAEEQLARRRAGLGWLLPWRAVYAYRLHAADALLRKAELTAGIDDANVRQQVARSVYEAAMHSWSAGIRLSGGSEWYRVRQKADLLAGEYQTVQVALQLEQWYDVNRQYPSDLSALDLPFKVRGLQYEASDGQHYHLRLTQSDTLHPVNFVVGTDSRHGDGRP